MVACFALGHHSSNLCIEVFVPNSAQISKNLLVRVKTNLFFDQIESGPMQVCDLLPLKQTCELSGAHSRLFYLNNIICAHIFAKVSQRSNPWKNISSLSRAQCVHDELKSLYLPYLSNQHEISNCQEELLSLQTQNKRSAESQVSTEGGKRSY